MIFKKQPKESILYTDTNIPAELFFDILENQEFSKLGTASPDKLEQVFDNIYDQYMDLLDDDTALNWYNRIYKTLHTKEKLAVLENCLYMINYMWLMMKPEEKDMAIRLINSIEDRPATENFPARYLVNFSPKDYELKSIKDEVLRVQNTTIAFLKNEIALHETHKKEDQKEVKYQYMEDLASIIPVMGYIPTNISLKEFVALKKTYLKIVEQKNKGNGSK